MKWFRIGACVAALTLVVAACGGDDSSDSSDDTSDDTTETTEATTEDTTEETSSGSGVVPVDEYAAALCGELDGLVDLQNEMIDTYNTGTSDDPATFQQEAIGLVEGYVADVQAAQARLAEQSPDIDDADEITQTFDDYLNGAVTELQSAVETFRAADPNGVAFQADVSVFELSINLLSTTLSDPFIGISDQDLLVAFDEEPSCAEVVEVTTF